MAKAMREQSESNPPRIYAPRRVIRIELIVVPVAGFGSAVA
jgi:hypothetical protein